MPGKDDWELKSHQRSLYSLGTFPMSIVPAVIMSWLLFFYRPEESGAIVLVGPVAIIVARLIGRTVDALVDPMIASWSDRSTARGGRRIPFVKWGAIPLAVCSVLIWYPPFPSTSSWINGLWLGVMLSLTWFFYTVSGVTYLALLPEITRSSTERVHLSVLMSYVDVAGMVGVPLLAGRLIDKFKDGATIGPIYFADGFKPSAVIVGAITVVLMYVSVWKMKEKEIEPSKTVPFKLIEAVRICLRNEAFVPYLAMIGLLRLGIDLVIVAIPFIVTTVMQSTPTVAGIGQALMPFVAAVLFPVVAWMAHKFGKKKVYQIAILLMVCILPLFVFIGRLPILSPMWQGLVLLGLLGIPASALLTMWRPMVADIIDYDEKRVGYRREAIYYGVEGLATKFAQGLAAGIVVILAEMGKAMGYPSLKYVIVGPVAAVIFLLGFLAFRSYPLNGHHVDEHQEGAREQ